MCEAWPERGEEDREIIAPSSCALLYHVFCTLLSAMSRPRFFYLNFKNICTKKEQNEEKILFFRRWSYVLKANYTRSCTIPEAALRLHDHNNRATMLSACSDEVNTIINPRQGRHDPERARIITRNVTFCGLKSTKCLPHRARSVSSEWQFKKRRAFGLLCSRLLLTCESFTGVLLSTDVAVTLAGEWQQDIHLYDEKTHWQTGAICQVAPKRL